MSFVKFAPQFGGSPNGHHLKEIEKSANFSEGRFRNQIETVMDLGFRSGTKVMYEWLFEGMERTPGKPLPVSFSDMEQPNDSSIKVTWFGHSAILLQIDGMNILIDPMLGDAASPVSFATRRFAYEQPIDLQSIPEIDAIVLSHDHYDHLDYKTILTLKDRVGHYFTPLGVGSHLRRWGVEPSKITELDWWETADFQGLSLVAAPARHFSGRGLTDRNKTQWASWVIFGKKEKIYFSGDSGYGPHFREIGEKYGPFDFAMMECGQYNEKWEAIHMMPEQTVQAAADLKCEVMMPIHWGAFNLALHSWTDPVERALAAANKKAINIYTPLIGKTFSPGEAMEAAEFWWRGM
jgi:L-ascorbate metabolism protein UlaG (beta-lactamase superfamily)